MRKALVVIASIVAVLVVAGFLFRGPLTFAYLSYSLKPGQAFASITPPAAPDYHDPQHWAALPDREDAADITPEGVADNQASADVDVFFIHPTTYYSGATWNQPLDDREANALTDDGVMRNQASAFNGCCRIFAPRYRQATLYSFFDADGGGRDALALAYADVEAAFDHYLAHLNDGRDFILAAHSQGALHLDTLLRNRFIDSDLSSRLIAAYPVGFYLDPEGGIPVCASPTQTGCQVTWNALAPGAPKFTDVQNPICVNPLTWRTDGLAADFADNLGAVTFGLSQSGNLPAPDNPGEVEAGAADAQCDSGRLVVSDIRSPNYPALPFAEGNYHIYDYNLFHMNIRANAEQRVQAWQTGR